MALGGILVEAIGPRGTLLLAGGGTVLVGIVGLVFYARLPDTIRVMSHESVAQTADDRVKGPDAPPE